MLKKVTEPFWRVSGQVVPRDFLREHRSEGPRAQSGNGLRDHACVQPCLQELQPREEQPDCDQADRREVHPPAPVLVNFQVVKDRFFSSLPSVQHGRRLEYVRVGGQRFGQNQCGYGPHEAGADATDDLGDQVLSYLDRLCVRFGEESACRRKHRNLPEHALLRCLFLFHLCGGSCSARVAARAQVRPTFVVEATARAACSGGLRV
mmetsp:Transcript_3765/g.9131  ORF Transcript_3765/g.9131 Transcript_3765/m.9131 type:complete len:206 (+) Transcript_3765:2352-2969(+)